MHIYVLELVRMLRRSWFPFISGNQHHTLILMFMFLPSGDALGYLLGKEVSFWFIGNFFVLRNCTIPFWKQVAFWYP
jgi:hypothetical protein